MSNWISLRTLYRVSLLFWMDCYILKPAGFAHLINLLFVVDEVTVQVILLLVCVHQLIHLLVPRVPLEEGVGTRDGPLQVVQLHTQIISRI